MAKDRHSTLGSKLGPRLAHLVTQANVHTEQKLLHTKHRLAMHVFEDASNMIGGELKAASGDLLEKLADHPATQPHTARLLRLAAGGQGQGGAITAAQLLGGSASSAIGTIFSNELYPAIAHIVGGDPHIPPGAETLAILAAKGIVGYGSAADTAGGQGMPPNWFEHLVEGSRAWPDLSVIIELWRRGEVSNDEASHLMQRIGLPAEVFRGILSLKRQFLAPADAALGLLRGSLSEGRAHEAARVAGLDVDDFTTLVENTGEPPALEELLLLWRRGQISTEKLDHGIRQSRVRNEWIDDVHKLGIIPPSASEALLGLLKGQISEEEARKRYKEAGGDPSWFTHAHHIEGSSPSPVELGDLANRGIIPWNGKGPDRTTFEQGFLEGEWRNKWLEPLRKLAVYYPPPRTIPTLYKNGGVNKAEAIKLLREQGVPEKLAVAYIVAASGEKVRKAKDIAEAQVVALYTDKAIDKAQALKMLGDLAFDRHEAEFLLTIADLAWFRRFTEAAIGTIHSRYTGHVIDRHTASADLDALQVPAHQREELLGLWDLERKAKVKLLTEAQVVKAVKKSLLDPAAGKARLEKMGYPAEDAEILLKL